MSHTIIVHQLRSKSDSAFLNVEDQRWGCLEVWGSCFKHPTYLAQEGIRYYLFIFDDEEYANEWLDGKNEFDSIIKIEPIEKKPNKRDLLLEKLDE